MKLIRLLIVAVIIVILACIYVYNQISVFRVRDINIQSSKIHNSIKITQISDFHSNSLINLDKLLDEITKFDPDFLVLTGDIIDYSDMELNTVFKLFDAITSMDKDIYFIHGNHETNHTLYDELRVRMESMGIVILENTYKPLVVKGEKINLIGLEYFIKPMQYRDIVIDINLEYYNILLMHSPNNVESLLTSKEDLILSGHTHGGQVRLPLIGSLIAPAQGFFPKYDKGIIKLNKSILYIDSGLGNSIAPIRAFNAVQISNITIEPMED